MYRPLPPLTRTNQKFLDRSQDESGLLQRQAFALLQSKEREQAIQRWYREGGKYFFQWVSQHYCLDNGEHINWREPYHPEFYQLMGNPWIESQIYEKGAQVGYTVALVAIIAFVLTEVKIPSGLGFETERKLRRMIPRIQRSFDYIEPLQRAREQVRKATRRKDVDNKEYQVSVAGVTGSFFYASTQTKDKSSRQASSSMSSFTAWVMCCDEVELFPEGGLDVARKRQAACPMNTKPLRAGSTPGHVGGMVDSMVKASTYLFQWSVECPHCNKRQLLHPFGNLLKPSLQESEDGTIEEVYLDVTGRPIDWHCHDRSSRRAMIKTAYVGCVECGGVLPFDVMQYRWADDETERGTGYFACCNTGITLRELMAQTITEQAPVKDWVALRLPRLASALFIAPDMIQSLIGSRNPADEIQQGLGISVNIGSGQMSLVRLQKCIGAPLPQWCRDRSPDLIVLGVDQGRAHHYAVETAWYFPPDTQDEETRWLGAHVELRWWGHLLGFDGIDSHATRNGIDLIGIDGEPEIQLAGAFARKHPAGQVYRVEKTETLYRPAPDGSQEIRLMNPAIATNLEAFLENLKVKIISKEATDSWLHYRVKFPRDDQQWLRAIDELLNSVMASLIVQSPVTTTRQTQQTRDTYKVFLFDQVELKGESFRKSERPVQDEILPVYAVHRTFGLDAVRDRIYRGRFHLPEGTLYDPRDDENLLVHLLASERTVEGTWQQSSGMPDHYHHALNFAEVAVLASFYEPKPKKLAFGVLERK